MRFSDPWARFFLFAFAFLTLTALGNGRLWQDEAETAILGKNILQFGYPKASDGMNRLTPADLPLGPHDAWIYHPWLTMYWVAASFKVLGADTAAARFPFALLGVLGAWLVYRVVRRLFRDRRLARWTLFLLSMHVPFLLHMRQCRYYAPSVLFSLWAVWAYWRLLRERRWAFVELLLSLLLLFHTNHGVFLPVAAALGLHLAWMRPERRVLTKGAGALLTGLLLCAPFLLLLQSSQHQSNGSWKELSHHAQFYFRQINIWILPVTVWALPVLLLWRSKFRRMLGEPGSPERAGWRLVVCLLLTGILFLIFVPYQRHFRYLVYLIPWLLVIHAALLLQVVRLNRWLGLALTGVLVFTNLNYAGPYALSKNKEKSQVHCYQRELIDEISHPYRGPADGIVEFLSREAKPGETLKTPFEDYPIIFYTQLKVESLPHIEDFANPTWPDWIVLRKDWLPGGFLESNYFKQIQRDYREMILDAPDIPWQNRPDPGYHRFRTDLTAPPVRIFRKRTL